MNSDELQDKLEIKKNRYECKIVECCDLENNKKKNDSVNS